MKNYKVSFYFRSQRSSVDESYTLRILTFRCESAFDAVLSAKEYLCSINFDIDLVQIPIKVEEV